jgi:hypothetical protein
MGYGVKREIDGGEVTGVDVAFGGGEASVAGDDDEANTRPKKEVVGVSYFLLRAGFSIN